MKIIKTLTLIIAMSCLTIACGSSGGGSGDGGSSGDTGQATITQSNAQSLSVGAYQQGQTGGAIAASNGDSSSLSSNIISPRALTIYQSLNSSIEKMDLDFYSNVNSSGDIYSYAIVNDKRSFGGPCGGIVDMNININDQTGEFNGTMDFKSYCDLDVTISGLTNFSGSLSVNNPSLNLSFDALTANSMGDSLTLSGSVVSTFTGSTDSITANMVIKDNNSGQTYKVENYQITMTDHGSYADITISGRYFDPVEGYVEVSTISTINLTYSSAWPSAGALLCTGTSGTKAKIIFTSSTQFMVEADADGNGAYEYNSGNINW